MDTNLILPLAHDRCRVVFDFYFTPDATPDFIRDSIAVANTVQDEDMLEHIVALVEAKAAEMEAATTDAGKAEVPAE
jgi:hypothetical protein